MISIEELTEKDIELLRNSKASVVKKLWYPGVVALVMSIIIPLLPWRYGNLVHVFPYPLAVSLLVLTFGLIIGIIYREDKRKYDKDIRYGKKIKYQGVVTSKERSVFPGINYYLWVNVDDDDDKRIRVSKEDYQQIGEGKNVSVEYAQMSMTFLRINLVR